MCYVLSKQIGKSCAGAGSEPTTSSPNCLLLTFPLEVGGRPATTLSQERKDRIRKVAMLSNQVHVLHDFSVLFVEHLAYHVRRFCFIADNHKELFFFSELQILYLGLSNLVGKLSAQYVPLHFCFDNVKIIGQIVLTDLNCFSSNIVGLFFPSICLCINSK